MNILKCVALRLIVLWAVTISTATTGVYAATCASFSNLTNVGAQTFSNLTLRHDSASFPVEMNAGDVLNYRIDWSAPASPGILQHTVELVAGAGENGTLGVTPGGGIVQNYGPVPPGGPSFLPSSGSLSGSFTTFTVPFGSPAASIRFKVLPFRSFVFDNNVTYQYSVQCIPAGPQPTTTTIVTSPNPSIGGDTVMYNVTVASPGGTPVGTVQISTAVGVNTFPLPLSAGGVLAIPSTSVTGFGLPLGASTVTATFQPGSTAFATSSGSTSHQVNTIPTTTTITSSLNPSAPGAGVSFTATVTSAGGTPTGTLQIAIPGVGTSTNTLVNGSTTFGPFTTIPLGTSIITATYSPALVVPNVPRFSGSVGNLSQVVSTPAVATTTSVTSSPNPSSFGQSVNLTATVSAASGTPTGSIEFFDDGTSLGAFAVNGAGVATLSTTILAIGNNNITATFTPTSTAFSGSVSPGHNHSVNAAITSSSVTSSPNPSDFGQTVVLTATVTSGAGSPTGNVEFFDDGASLGSSAVNGAGVATLSTAGLAIGNNSITATFTPATAAFSGSAAPAHIHAVNALISTTTIASSLNPSLLGGSVTFTATVTPATASGSVEFREGATVLGSGNLSGGVATFTTSTLTVGTHPISAHYLGAPAFLASASTPLNQTVNALPATDDSAKLDDVQESATGVAAAIASEGITDSVAEEIGAALTGQVQVFSASEGKVGLVYAPGIGKSIITPTADLASGETEFATWRIWTSLRYTDVDSSELEGDQINVLLGTSFLFGNGMVAGLVAGYENQDYEDDVNATLKGEGFNIGGYVGGSIVDGLRFDAQLHASFLNYDLASGAVEGSTDGTRLIAAGGLVHTISFGATTIEPTARFSGTWEWQDGYTDSAVVNHDERNFHFGRIAAGAKISHQFDLGDGASFSPYIAGYADYRYSRGDTTKESYIDGLSARIGLGASLNAANGISASVLAEFSGLGLNNNTTVQSYKAQLAIPF